MSKRLLIFLFALFVLLFFTSCSESLEERAARECREYTAKNCPTPVVNYERTDSLTFDAPSKTLTYWRKLCGRADNAELVGRLMPKLREALRSSTLGNPRLRNYREAGFHFRYVYRSESTGRVMIEEKI